MERRRPADWPPRTWPLWLFWFGIFLGAMFWAFGVVGAAIAAGLVLLLAFAVANDWLG